MTTLEQATKLFHDVLGEDYLSIDVSKLSLEDDLENSTSTATIQLRSGESFSGHGRGIVDAVFNALFDHYSNEFESLKSIQMTRFIVEADQKTKLDNLGSSALCTVCVETMNSRGKKFFFTDSSRSVSSSAAKCASRVAEHFVNAEKAYIVVWKAYKDSQERNRQDLVTKYLDSLALLVDNTSYSHVVESIEKDLNETGRRDK